MKSSMMRWMIWQGELDFPYVFSAFSRFSWSCGGQLEPALARERTFLSSSSKDSDIWWSVEAGKCGPNGKGWI
jgi:hypothetical protein